MKALGRRPDRCHFRTVLLDVGDAARPPIAK